MPRGEVSVTDAASSLNNRDIGRPFCHRPEPFGAERPFALTVGMEDEDLSPPSGYPPDRWLIALVEEIQRERACAAPTICYST